MSWLDRILNQELIIRTGDGQEFRPIWKNASKSRNYNSSRFEFTEIDGTLVRSGKVSGLIIPFEFHFQGLNNIDEVNRFERASKDTRPWLLRHPLYEDIICRPSTISFNNNSNNVTVVTGELWETIEDTFPNSDIDIKTDVIDSVYDLEDRFVFNFATNFKNPDSSSISKIGDFINKIADKLRLAATTDFDLENIENSISDVLSSLDSISSSANIFMSRTAKLFRTPSNFYNSVKGRIKTMEDSYQDLKNAYVGLINVNDKLFFETIGGIILGAKSEISVTKTKDIADEQDIENNTIKDYQTRNEVIEIANNINNNVNDYFNQLGIYQTQISSNLNSYVPDGDNINAVKNSTSKATSQLLQIAVDSKQERIYTTDEKISIVLLVHKLLGTSNKEVIEDFVRTNEISLQELLLIDQGRKVKYFI